MSAQEPSASVPTRPPRAPSPALEVLVSVLLGLVSAATALGAYQAANWSIEASALHEVSQELRDRNLGDYLTGALAFDDDSTKLAQAIALEAEVQLDPSREGEVRAEQQRLLEAASPGVAQQWQAWVEADFAPEAVPLGDAYREELFLEPASANRASAVTYELAMDLEHRSVTLTAAAVVFALALLLLGVAGVAARHASMLVLTGGGALAFAVGLIVTVATIL